MTKFVEVFKIGVRLSDYLIVEAKFLSTEPFLQVNFEKYAAEGAI